MFVLLVRTLMVQVLALALVSSSAGCATRSSETEPRSWVILAKAPQLGTAWIPEAMLVQDAVDGARSYLQKLPRAFQSDYGKGEIEKILGRWDHYACQVVGYFRDGKRLVRLNFLIPSNARRWGVDWRKDYLEVEDGGAAYWHIDFEPQSKCYLNFYSNGYG